MAQILPIDEALARKRLNSRDADLIRVTVDERRQATSQGDSGWQPGMLQATPRELSRLSKGG